MLDKYIRRSHTYTFVYLVLTYIFAVWLEIRIHVSDGDSITLFFFN